MSDHKEKKLEEISIAANIEQSGISVSAKSRAFSALDRLIGSLFDLPSSFLESVTLKKRLRDEVNERLISAQMIVAEQKIHDMPELGLTLINDVLKDKARKQANVAGVAVEAINAMKALPPPQKTTEEASTEDSKAKIEDDWMNQFSRYAEDASSDHLQQIWGRVLAGEIQEPGSFSRHTLRFIAELDKKTAENCEIIRRYVVGNWFFHNKKWHTDELFLVSVDLRRLGIIEGGNVGGPEHISEIRPDGSTGIFGETYGLIVQGDPGTKLTFPVFLLTRLGQQVMSLLKIGDEAASLREVVNSLNKTNLKIISLGLIEEKKKDAIIFKVPLEVLWKSDQKE
ncbi:DUF2806 domain-containing protein [Gluconobacter albidus]|uniref:DUF2806 domain-containing protein n=1 Tax=Gluconobacter albidus TaxID=318683 RepID=UPI0030AB58A4